MKTFEWKDVSTLKGAEDGVQCGFAAAAWIASITAVISVIAFFEHSTILGITRYDVVVAALYGALAFGIRKKSRACAAITFVLFVGGRIGLMTNGAVPPSAMGGLVIGSLFFGLWLLHGVRGTIAYRKLAPKVVSVAVATQ